MESIRTHGVLLPLLQMVDDVRITFSSAVELSYLNREEQVGLDRAGGRHAVAVTGHPHEAAIP